MAKQVFVSKMPIEIPLTKGYVALVDARDYERVTNAGKWHARVEEYGVYAAHNQRRINGVRPTPLRLHRFILGITDLKTKVDHKDHDGLNCQRHNLRVCTDAQNNGNRRKIRKTSSVYKGVSWNKERHKWEAKIQIKHRTVHLGRFTSQIKAARAYYEAAKGYFGEFACTNFSS